jgi:hypothetical protein
MKLDLCTFGNNKGVVFKRFLSLEVSWFFSPCGAFVTHGSGGGGSSSFNIETTELVDDGPLDGWRVVRGNSLDHDELISLTEV